MKSLLKISSQSLLVTMFISSISLKLNASSHKNQDLFLKSHYDEESSHDQELINEMFPKLSEKFIEKNKIILEPNLDDGFEDGNFNIAFLTIYVSDRNQPKTVTYGTWGDKKKVVHQNIGSFKVLLSYPMVSNLFDYNAEEENSNLTAFYKSFKKLVAMHKPKTLNNYKALINYFNEKSSS